jgi:hypothetical protein
MGNFYTSYTLRGPSQQLVAAALAGRSAIVTPVQDNCVVVYDEESDDQNFEVIAELASRLSERLRCPLLAVLNHDDGILWYQLYLNGELVDEYNSSPGYFNDSDEESAMAGPEGGDAKKLCEAFDANTVNEVEKILRKPALERNGYVFAVERHADLVGALGIPSIAVGGFEQVEGGELPEDLNARDCIRTKELAAGPASSTGPEPIPGYYKVSFRAHPKMKACVPIGWMPAKWAELECREQDLSEDFRKATAALRDKFKQLGFLELGFKKLTRVLNPFHLDNGGVNYWDDSHSYYAQLIYNKRCSPPRMLENQKVLIAFTAVFQHEVLSCTNNMQTEVAPLSYHKVTRIDSNDAELLYKNFSEQLQQYAEQPRQFQDLPSLQSWSDSYQFEMFEQKVRQRLWIRMSDYEAAKARRKLPPRT